jgi:hypothetical protein
MGCDAPPLKAHPPSFGFSQTEKTARPSAVGEPSPLKEPLENTTTVARACQSANAYFPLFAGAFYRR